MTARLEPVIVSAGPPDCATAYLLPKAVDQHATSATLPIRSMEDRRSQDPGTPGLGTSSRTIHTFDAEC